MPAAAPLPALPRPRLCPRTPFRVPDTTPVCARVAILDALADDCRDEPGVVGFAEGVRALAARRYGLGADGGAEHDPAALATAALAAAQALPFVPDPAGQEWYQGAGYTAAHGGDCDDLVVLMVAALRRLGVRVVPYWITQTGQPLNHVTALVDLPGAGWTWADPSIVGARLGEDPYAAARRTGDARALGLVSLDGPGDPAGDHRHPPGTVAPAGVVADVADRVRALLTAGMRPPGGFW